MFMLPVAEATTAVGLPEGMGGWSHEPHLPRKGDDLISG
jgi:hypothetical protein